MQTELLTSMMIDIARTAMPSVQRIYEAYPEKDFVGPPEVRIRTTFARQEEVGIGELWSTGRKANRYDFSVQFDIYGDDTLDADRMVDDISDYIASHRSGMQSWADASGNGPSMIDATLIGLADLGYIEEWDSWRKMITYLVPVIKPH